MADVPAASQIRTAISDALPRHECNPIGEDGRTPASLCGGPAHTLGGLVGDLGGRLLGLSFHHQHPGDVFAVTLFPAVFTRGKHLSRRNDPLNRMTAVSHRTVDSGNITNLTSCSTHNSQLPNTSP